MLIWIAAATFIALGFGSFVVLLVAVGISGQAVESDLDLEEQPIEQDMARRHSRSEFSTASD